MSSPAEQPGAEPQKFEKHHFEIMMEEYKSLRTESLNTINNRITLLVSAFTSLTIITSATVVAKLPGLIICAVLALAVPTLAKALALAWIAEYRRSQRAGGALAKLEKKINGVVGQECLTWESGLRSNPESRISAPYVSSVGILVMLAYLSEGLALYYIFQDASAVQQLLSYPISSWWVTGFVFIFLAGTEVASFFLIRSEWRRARAARL